MSALVEAHDAGEIEQAKQAGARIIGVNNRNLKDFSVDISHSARLRQLAGEETVFVSESGIRGPEDMKALCENGTDRGADREMLMRSPDRQAALKHLCRRSREDDSRKDKDQDLRIKPRGRYRLCQRSTA